MLKLQIKPIKRFEFTWAPAAGATFYRLLERPQQTEEYVQLADDIVGLSSTQIVPLHLRFDASYIVQACNSGGCTDSAPVDVMDSMASAVGYFKPSNTKAHFYFGESIALSADGKTLVVGAPFEDGASVGINGDQNNQGAADSGAAYVFARSDDGEWVQQAYIKASNAEAGDRFGYSISLSADGDTMAVAAFFEDGPSTGVNGDQGNGVADSGAVYTFVRSNAVWSQQAYIKASNKKSGLYFGASVELSADGKTLAVGSENENSAATGINGNQADVSAPNAGAVYVFTYANATWAQQAYVKASNTNASDFFGHAVALSSNGDVLAVGAFQEASAAVGIGGNQADNSAPNAGAVYVYTRAGNTWTQQAYIKASNTNVDDLFGAQIDLAADGNTLAVGAPYESSATKGIGGNQGDNSASRAGAAYVFRRANNVWSQDAYVKASNTDPEDRFGYCVSLTADGNLLAVSAAYESSSATGMNGDQMNNAAPNSGAAYMFVRTNGTWAQRSYVKASSTYPGLRLGDSTALSSDGSTFVTGSNLESSAAKGIGGNQADMSAMWAGAAHVY